MEVAAKDKQKRGKTLNATEMNTPPKQKEKKKWVDASKGNGKLWLD
jgi:hypothetical protein